MRHALARALKFVVFRSGPRIWFLVQALEVFCPAFVGYACLRAPEEAFTPRPVIKQKARLGRALIRYWKFGCGGRI